MQSVWEEKVRSLNGLIMKPILYNNLQITLLDALGALHEQDWEVGEHRHPWFEFNYVSDGAVFTTMEGREFLAQAGSFYLIPPGIFHSHRNCEFQGDDGFCLRWQLGLVPLPEECSGIPALAQDIEMVLSCPRPSAEIRDMSGLLGRIPGNTGLAVLQGSFLRWLLELYEYYKGGNAGEPEKTVESRDSVLVRQALLYLEEYHSHPLKVQELANSLNISYRHLARMFRQSTGLTLIEKLNDIRISHAKRLLKETEAPVHEIAIRVGFDNEFYFSSSFRRYALISPSGFRKKCRSQEHSK